MNTDKSRLQEFLYGFARGADIDLSEASAQWAGHSAQLSDDERRNIEAQGEDSGFSEGQAFAKLYPPSDLLRDGVEISLSKLENVESSNPHFMFIGRHGELFATVKMHDMSTGENRIVSHEDECTGETERSAYRECMQRGEAIAMGTTIAEPVRDL